MADNYVRILVKASDDARPDLDELKAKLQELGREVDTARAQVDDADAAAKLDRLRAKLDELDHRTARPKITMAGALRAEAEIHAVEASLDRLNRKADELKVKADTAGARGLLGRLFFGLGSDAAGGGGGAGGIGGGLMSPLGIGAIALAVEALLPEVTALLSGFAAAGTGAGAFALLAVPAFKQVETAYTGLNTAQQAYQAAQAKYNEDPSKSNLTALKNAALNLDLVKDKLKQMPQAEQGAVGGVQNLATEFGKLSKAFQPQAFKVFDDVLKIANNLLPVITPLASAFAGAIDGLLQKAGKFTESKGFKDFLKQFEGLVGPSTTAIGNGIGQLVTEFGKLLTIFSKKDVVNAINIAFSVLNGTLEAIIVVVSRLKRNWDELTGAFDRNRHQIAQAFDAARHDVATFAHDIAAHFDEIRHDIAQWAGDVGRDTGKVITWFKNLPGNILKGLGDLKKLLVQAGEDVVTGFINGIESMFGSIVTAAGSMISHLGHSVLHLLGIGSPSKVAHWWGQMVAQGMADGIDAHAHLVAGAASRMALRVPAGLAAGAGAGGYGYAAGGGPVQLQLQIAPGGASEFEQFMLLAIRNWVRIKGGGDVQKAFGR
jgi:hypothetical protein